MPSAGEGITTNYTPCSVDSCQRAVVARGWCRAHYNRWWNHGEVSPEIPIGSTSNTEPDPCRVDSCDHVAHGYELCSTHLYRLQNLGGVQADVPIGGLRDVPAGTRRKNEGYVVVKLADDSPFLEMAYSRIQWVKEHRLVMAEHLGRPLTSDESVHHKNGVRDDNRLENLQLRKRHHGKGTRWVCNDCGSHDVSAVEL